MDNENSQTGGIQRLKALLKEAGLKSFALDGNRRVMLFGGRSREWTIVARMQDGWLNLYTWMCELPAESGLRARTLEVALALNRQMPLTKFVGSDALMLELDYRAEHVDAGSLQNLVALLNGNAEEYYPKIFRTVMGDDVLASLGDLSLTNASTRPGAGGGRPRRS